MSTATGWSNPRISYWHTTAPLDLAADDIPATTDVVVIGGGLMGSCTTYWLARSGVKVTLVEQGAPAFGATGRNGGFHVVGTAESYASAIERHGPAAARTVYQITHASRAILRQVLSEESITCDYREPGRLNLALSTADYAEQRRSVDALHADGFTVELLERAQVQELIDTPLGPEIAGAIYAREDGLLQPARLIQGVQSAARRRGARLCAATVTGLASSPTGVTVTTSAGAIQAGTVVVAVNAWTSRLIPALTDVITPVRGQILNYAPMPIVFRPGVGAGVTATGEYWHQTPDGSIVLGGCRAVAPGGEVGLLEDGTTPEVQSAIEQVFPRLFPALRGLHVERRWSGPMAFTRDYMPICDRVPDLPRAWVVGGFCGHGMPFGMRLGQLLSEAALSDRKPAELHPLRIDRPTLLP